MFLPEDRRHLAAAVGELTHDEQSTFELGLDYGTPTGGRKGRAVGLIRQIFDEEANPDPVILELLNYIYMESSSGSHRRQGETYKTLKELVLDPRGIILTASGFESPPNKRIMTATSSRGQSAPVTSPTVDSVHTSVPEEPVSVASTVKRDPSRVFIVSGRDTRPVKVVEQFLLYIGLRPIEWSTAREWTGKSQPTTFEIVEAGMAGAGAVIVIFSPDDEARLRPKFTPGDEDDEPLTGQARQNVILEAGLAFGLDRQRTIFVRSERTRPISDVDGFNFVSLDGSTDRRRDLYKRLKGAGAQVASLDDIDLSNGHAGAFEIS